MFDKNWALLGKLFLCVSGLTLIACGSGNESGFIEALEVNSRNITSIEVRSSNDRVRVTETEQFSAFGIKDGVASEDDISNIVRWSSSDPSLVSIDENGKATGIANGDVEISAMLSDLSASKTLTSSDVALTSIEIGNLPVSIDLCQTREFALSARGTYADGGTAIISDKVTWSSSSPNIIHIGDEDLSDGSREDKGILSGLSIGASNIVASQGVIDSTPASLSVVSTLSSITVSSESSTLYAEESNQFSAQGDYGVSSVDITQNVQWSSSDTAVLDFSDLDSGLAELITHGSSNVTATCDPGGSGELVSSVLPVDVEEPVSVTSLIIKEGGKSYGNDATIILDLEDAETQLALFFVYSNTKEGTADLAEESETTWSVIGSALSGVAADISSTGLVAFDAVGESEYTVRYKDDDEGINVDIDFFIKVE